MNTDFTAILAVLVLVSGFIWGIDAWFFARKRVPTEAAGGSNSDDDKKRREPLVVEYARFLFPVFLVVLIVRGFIV